MLKTEILQETESCEKLWDTLRDSRDTKTQDETERKKERNKNTPFLQKEEKERNKKGKKYGKKKERKKLDTPSKENE